MAPNRILSVTASIDTIGEILLKIIPTLEEVSQNKEGKVMKFFTADIDSYVLLIVIAVHQMSLKLLTFVLIIHNAKYVNGQTLCTWCELITKFSAFMFVVVLSFFFIVSALQWN